LPQKWDDDDGLERVKRDGKTIEPTGSIASETITTPFLPLYALVEVKCQPKQVTLSIEITARFVSGRGTFDDSIGDRKSTCLSSMEPLGLTIKRDGSELMIVHRCTGCGKIGKKPHCWRRQRHINCNFV